MQCPKCGKKLNKGRLYCENCGEEIRIVPDFEPEIESRIDMTMSEVAEAVEPEGSQSENSDFFDLDYEVKETKTQKKMYMGIISTVSIVLVLTLIIIFIKSLHTGNFVREQLENAKAAFKLKDYEKSISIYEEVMKYNDSEEVMIAYAESLYAAGNYDKALSYLYSVIENQPDNEVAYAVIIAMYDEQRDFDELNHLLQNCTSESILDKFGDYMSFPPEFSVTSGKYDKVTPVVLSSSAVGKIFYSLDGSNPEKEGIEFTSPIVLKNGTYHIKAVFINDYGIVSDVAEAEYEIECQQPVAPIISPDSGVYDTPQMITVVAEPNTTIYYTTDGTMPTEKSLLYGEPIPMKEGVSNYHFIVIDENGVSSEKTSRSYQLSIAAALTADESVYRLKHRLLEREMITDLDGHIPDRKGQYLYIYESLRMIDNKVLYTISEYYTEVSSHRNKTGRVYAIDVSNGYVYMIIEKNDGTEGLKPI